MADFVGRSVVLLSGGQDSTLALFDTLRWRAPDQVEALFVEYGQRHRVERRAAEAIASIARVRLRAASVELQHIGRSDLLSDDGRPPTDVVVPHRNMMLLGMAASLASAIDATEVVIGCCSDDAELFEDCRRPFLEAMQALLGIRLVAPWLRFDKASCVRAARELDGRFGGLVFRALAKSWSCYDPQAGPKPCGSCLACRKRADGFAKADVPDPAIET